MQKQSNKQNRKKQKIKTKLVTDQLKKVEQIIKYVFLLEIL